MKTASSRTKAQESSTAIGRMYITMRHLFNRGFYKPMGISGESLRQGLLSLEPEIYGTISESKSEINGLEYVIDRLPEGIAECRFVNLTSEEGYGGAHFTPIIPPKRRRNCYRIDAEQMNIEITRGRSEIYDILTHVTFLYIEADKICDRVLISKTGRTTRDFEKLEQAVLASKKLTIANQEIAITHTANILGRSFSEIKEAYDRFSTPKNPKRFLQIIYFMGKLAINERIDQEKRTITFSPLLRERIGHHIHGEIWANKVKQTLEKQGWLNKPLHLISSNMHSVLNTLYAPLVAPKLFANKDSFSGFETLSKPEAKKQQEAIFKYAQKQGMVFIEDTSGANVNVQLFDLSKINWAQLPFEPPTGELPIIIVMDYAFGEQAYETVDELLKPYQTKEGNTAYLSMKSISIMGKAGILEGDKGDIMIPSAHIFEGTSDNYPFYNDLTKEDMDGFGLSVFEGSMVTVLGTSLQNKDILLYFRNSTWNSIGIEMEGAHYQKAIQSASKIRKSISSDVVVRYAYYASDNPLKTGSTLASGGLGTTGVKPTYLITHKMIQKIINSK